MMNLALEIAKKSINDIPVGAIIAKEGRVIAQCCNKREEENKITSHAEILAINIANQKLNNWRLEGCEMYVTLEPCPMCAWAILQSRIARVYFGSYNHKYGAFGSSVNLLDLSDFKPQVFGGIQEEACNKMLEEFWNTKRNLIHINRFS